MEVVTHVPLGEYNAPSAARRDLKGIVTGYFLAPWGIEKP